MSALISTNWQLEITNWQLAWEMSDTIYDLLFGDSVTLVFNKLNPIFEFLGIAVYIIPFFGQLASENNGVRLTTPQLTTPHNDNILCEGTLVRPISVS